jgi:hypothetical protein
MSFLKKLDIYNKANKMTPEEFNQEIEKAYKIQQNLKKMLTKINNNLSSTIPMDNKEKLDSYITRNYDELNEIATNILSRIKQEEYASVLVSEAYSFIYDRLDTLGELTDNRLKSVFINYIQKQVVWNKTSFKKTFINNLNLPVDSIIGDEQMELFMANNKIYTDNYSIENDYIEEENRLSEQKYKQDLINQLNQNYNKLSQPDKILFNLYYKSEYNSAAKIAKYINTSKSSVVGMLKKMKLQILEKNDTN